MILSSCFPSRPFSSFSSVSCCLMRTPSKFFEFPFALSSEKKLMVDLVSTLENRFHSQLLPFSLPSHVQHYQSQNGAAQGSLHIREGHTDSPVDCVLGNWLHAELPTGGSLDITSLLVYLNSSTDAPNFLFEITRSSPTVLVFFLDLLPRKDFILWPDNLKSFYEDTKLDMHRQALEKVPEVQTYLPSSLYVRALFSPAAVIVRIETENDGVERMEEIIRNHLDPISKQVLRIWMDCACAKQEVGEADKAYLSKRDELMKKRGIEIDMGSTYPKLFGPETANRVVEAVKEYLSV